MAVVRDGDLSRLVDVAEILTDDIAKCVQNVCISMHTIVPIESLKVQDITPEVIDKLCARLQELSAKIPDGLIDQFWGRALVRSMFAFIEGVTYELRRILLTAQKQGDIELSEAESAVLSDVVFDVGENGSISTRPRFVPLERNLRLVYAVVVRTFGAPVFPSTDPRFRFLSDSIRLRNRLTHPKGADGLTLTFQETMATIAVFAWFGDLLGKLTDYWKQKRLSSSPA